MNAIAYSEAFSHFAEVLEKVCDDHAPIVITRDHQRPVVLMSLEDYEAMEENGLFVAQSPKCPPAD